MRGFTDETAPHELLFECLGVSLRVCASTEEVLERIAPLLPLDRAEGGSLLTAHRLGIVSEDDLTFSVYNSHTRVSEGGDLALALVTLEGQVRSHISLHAPGLVFVRAGVVGYEGRAIVLPGASFSGKTTLVAALVHAGARYYSDEFAVIDPDGRVHPYASALALRLESEHPRAGTEGVTAAVSKGPLPVGLVVSTYYRPGVEWRPDLVNGAAAALELIAHTPTVTTRPGDAVKAITKALDGAVMLKGERGEADAVASSLLERLVQSAPADPPEGA